MGYCSSALPNEQKGKAYNANWFTSGICRNTVNLLICAAQVQRALLPSLGGHANATFDEVVARIARAKVRFSVSPCINLAKNCKSPCVIPWWHAAATTFSCALGVNGPIAQMCWLLQAC